MPTITACVVARDEAENLVELLPALRWADEVLVLIDDATRDDSQIIAEACADRVELRPFGTFPSFRNTAMDLARSDWIFFVDADERVSPALAEEVRAAIAGDSSPAQDSGAQAPVAYWVPRLNIMFGRLISGGGWYPDEQHRLLRRDAARYDEARLVHELPIVNGSSGHLHEPLLHLSYNSIPEFIAKQRRYNALAVAPMIQAGVFPRRRTLLGAPFREFTHRYFTLRGWTDGPVGLFLSLTMAYYTFQRVRLARQAAMSER
jgi:glycosyltransferase involved in cell wall biosynthesis